MFVFKKKIPNCEALKECYEKGVESKEHVRELKKDPFSILNFCDAFFRRVTVGAISRFCM